jgi:hypothetical protein
MAKALIDRLDLINPLQFPQFHQIMKQFLLKLNRANRKFPLRVKIHPDNKGHLSKLCKMIIRRQE